MFFVLTGGPDASSRRSLRKARPTATLSHGRTDVFGLELSQFPCHRLSSKFHVPLF